MGGGSSSQPTTTTTLQSNDPAEWAKPVLSKLGSDTLTSYNAGEFAATPYEGSTIVPFAEQTQQAMGILEGLGQDGSATIEAANQQVGSILDQGGLNAGQQGQIENMARVASGSYRPEQMAGVEGLMETASGSQIGSNPHLDGILERGATQISRSVNDAMGSAGRYGSGAHQATLGDSVGDFTRNVLMDDYTQGLNRQSAAQGQLIGAGQSQDGLATSAAGGAFNAMNTGNQNVFQAAGMAPNLYTAQALPSEFLMDVGSMHQDLAARELDENIARHDAEQMAPYAELQRLNALASGAIQTGGTSTSTVRAPSSQPSTASNILGGASAGAGIGSAFGPLGTGIGAIGGGLLGGFF